MKHITSLLLMIFLTCATVLAQTYTTPNTGVDWTLTDIANASPSTISVNGSEFTLLENLVIAENDKLRIDTDATVLFEDAILLSVFGEFEVSATQSIFTAADTSLPYEGFRFEEFSTITIQNATITKGGGLRVLTEDFTIDNCIITENVEGGATTGAVISLSRGTPQITNNEITFNELPAISAAANSDVSATISGNYIEGNNTLNANRPQINLGTTSTTEDLQIIDNIIIGDPLNTEAGGIAIANLVGGTIRAVISNNEIRDNRYGIAVIGGNATVEISHNIIEDNTIQNNPNLGGSGININSSTNDVEINAFLNEIRRNLWGITLQGEASINLGNGTTNPGENIFSENGNNNETFALYNNTPNTISALNNCWVEGVPNTLAIAESVIFHQVDDNTLGEVLFDPVACTVLSVSENNLETFSFYPNPTQNNVHFAEEFSIETVEIFTTNGVSVFRETDLKNQNEVTFNLTSGMYFVRFTSNDGQFTKKLLID
ncbi:T9SS type A sorting domain-containing protein [Marinirhabdus gelatinilytica]|uniref:Putative secreted protein (Por secretion system target) n=1 Tax=Marinirhabdus gelatinilytica TaxID=1703343 RepID=A0A370QKX2_9FLAO|nr:T9SS type A sorting domain-containing protein [Marinirhabdus gelatinilytica]RDK89023.1 putative secreted protein (Por secretion system target) [Marinirhabdus gelatinilytica]